MQKINFQDYPNITTPVNASNLNQIQTNVENAINDVENVELLTVSSTAPSECSTGDKYFNTTSNLIYTAIGTNTWSSTGETPIANIFYIVLSEQKIYTYNGTTLINAGGNQALNNYSTSTTESYSASYVNDLSNDYIVDQGTSGGWTYRKWNSGISECWKNISGTVSVTTAWGNALYYGTIAAESFPTDLFNDVPTMHLQNIGGSSLICMNSATATATSTGAIQVTRAASSSNAGYIVSIRAIGTWR